MINFKGKVNIVFSIQFSQVSRFIVFLIISSVFAKQQLSHLSKDEIGNFEMMMLISAALSYFWVTGIIQTFLPLYNNNHVFPKRTYFREKSPEIFNTFLMLAFFSVSFALLIFIFRHNIYVYKTSMPVPHVIPLVIFFVLSNTTPLIEYIYYVRNRPYQIINYVFWTSVVQIVLVCGAVLLNLGIEIAIWALISIYAVRFIWLLVLLERYAEFKFSYQYIKTHFKLGMPLILSSLLSGSSQYIDGFIASWTLTPERFATFRYGSKELPFSKDLSNGLNNAMLRGFATAEKMKSSLNDLKVKSLRLMHYLFPLSIIVMLGSKWIFISLFTQEFSRSADIFMVYLLMIISRMVFPQTILIGLKKTRVVFWASLIEIILNIAASLFFIYLTDRGLVGIALGTTLVHALEKIFLIAYNYYKLGIPPQAYIPVRWFVFYCFLITLVFVLIDRNLITIY